MYKIKFLETGNIFELSEQKAKELKEKYPNEYKIIEKNGKKFKDKIVTKKNVVNSDSIYEQIVEK